MSKNRTRRIAACLYACLGLSSAVALGAWSQGALADPVSPAGWTTGLQLGTPLPQGLYFIDTGTYFERYKPGGPKIDAFVNLPVLAWSTPAMLLGGRLEVLAIAPELGVGINPGGGAGSAWFRDIYNPAGLAGLAWDLGGGWSIGDHVGAFIPVDTTIGNAVGLGGNFWTFVDILGIAYNSKDGWSASANFTYSHSFNNVATGIQDQPDTAQLDLAITKHFDKWEIGLVGYGSGDLSNAARNGFGVTRQDQFALGGLVGYNFGPVITQFSITRDVAEKNYAGYDTRFWGRVIIPMWSPAAPAPRPVIAKY